MACRLTPDEKLERLLEKCREGDYSSVYENGPAGNTDIIHVPLNVLHVTMEKIIRLKTIRFARNIWREGTPAWAYRGGSYAYFNSDTTKHWVKAIEYIYKERANFLTSPNTKLRNLTETIIKRYPDFRKSQLIHKNYTIFWPYSHLSSLKVQVDGSFYVDPKMLLDIVEATDEDLAVLLTDSETLVRKLAENKCEKLKNGTWKE